MKREGGKSQELLMQSQEETAKELVSWECIIIEHGTPDLWLKSIIGIDFKSRVN